MNRTRLRRLALLMAIASLLILAADAVIANTRGQVGPFSIADILTFFSPAAWSVPGASTGGLAHLLQLPAFLLPMAAGGIFWLASLLFGRSSDSAEPVAADKGGKVSTTPPSPLTLKTHDADFLPASLEILVTPPSPVAIGLIGLISATVLAGLAWSYFGWLDIHAVAPGRIQLSGRSKVIQPLEPGRISNIRVKNGQFVHAGDVLLELDATETSADRQAIERTLHSVRAEEIRRRAAIGAAGRDKIKVPELTFGNGIAATLRQRETRGLQADLAELASGLASIRGQIAEKNATKARLKAGIAARARLIELARERVAMRKTLKQRGAGSRALIIESQQQLQSFLTTDAGERGELAEADAAIASMERRLVSIRAQFIASQTGKLLENGRQIDRLEQELIKSRSKNERTQLRAPIDGTVQQLDVTTVGQVVTTGQALMTIVPADADLEVEALVSNRDIGFVHMGQHAVVKIDAFPFTRYGTISAEVVRVSREAVDASNTSTLSDATTSISRQSRGGRGIEQPQNLVFPATLRLARKSLSIDGRDVPLVSGMSVMVEIKTGERRAIDYVLSPLREMTSRAAHER